MSTTRISVVGVHVLDTHVIGVESIPSGSDDRVADIVENKRVRAALAKHEIQSAAAKEGISA